MGALMSRLWADIVQYMGWVAVPSGYGSQRISNVGEETSDSTEVMDTGSSSPDSGELPEGSTVRQRIINSSENGEKSPKKIDSTSPVKSTWNDITEHPKPKLDIAPPNKKTKTESDKKDSLPLEDMQFESVPNLHFGDKEEAYCPESLSPDYLTPPANSDSHGQQNGHAEEDANVQSFGFAEKPTDLGHLANKDTSNESHSQEEETQNGDNMIQDAPEISIYTDASPCDVTSHEKEQGNLTFEETSKSLGSNRSPCDVITTDKVKDSTDQGSDDSKIILIVNQKTSGVVEQKGEGDNISNTISSQVMKEEVSCKNAVKDPESESPSSDDVVMTTENLATTQDIVTEDPNTCGSIEPDGEENKACGDNAQHQKVKEVEENGNEKTPQEDDDQEYHTHIGNGEKMDCSEKNSECDAKIFTNGELHPLKTNVEQNKGMQLLEDNSACKNGTKENYENVDPNMQKVNESAGKTKQICVQWTGDAENVFITGTWLEWKDKVELQKSDENIWSASLDVEENIKEIEMKFIVDGNWLISPDIPSIEDASGNRNNYIKLTH